MTISSNIADRIRILRIILTQRSIWSDLSDMSHAYHRIDDIRANAHPFTFVETLFGSRASLPNFAEALGTMKSFERADTPKWNSESNVSEFLGALIFHLRPRTVVELGCFIGWTSAHLALGLREAGLEGTLWCIDNDPHFLQDARTNLTRLSLDKNVTFLRGRSLDDELMAKLPSAIDVVFIDTSHSYETTRREIATYAQRLTPGGYVILHDSISFPGVRRAVGEVWDQFHSITFATERSDGLTVLWQKGRV
jgi:predicted O-methyltransferase YrrM